MKSSVIGLPNHPTVDLTLLNFGFITIPLLRISIQSQVQIWMSQPRLREDDSSALSKRSIGEFRSASGRQARRGGRWVLLAGVVRVVRDRCAVALR